MSHDLYTYAATDRIYFKLTLDGVGQPSLTLENTDVKLYQDGANVQNIGDECTNVGLGIYYWTPSSSTQTDCEVMQINIKDDDSGGEFDENCLIIVTGGHPSARFSG